MRRRLNLAGKVAVVTGGASGIGRGLARALASRGCHVAVADIDEAGLRETARLVGNAVRITCHRLDVADFGAVAAFPAEVERAHGAVDVVVNNAGVALGGTFEQLTEADFDWLIRINFEGVVKVSRAFLPLLQTRPVAQLVNVSSIYGLIAPPYQTAYAAAKFAVRGFSESLRHELLIDKSPVGVSLVHPGGIKTNIVATARIADNVPEDLLAEQRARWDKLLRMSAEQAGEIIAKGIERRAPRIMVGNDAKFVATVERIVPVSYWRLLEPAF